MKRIVYRGQPLSTPHEIHRARPVWFVAGLVAGAGLVLLGVALAG